MSRSSSQEPRMENPPEVDLVKGTFSNVFQIVPVTSIFWKRFDFCSGTSPSVRTMDSLSRTVPMMRPIHRAALTALRLGLPVAWTYDIWDHLQSSGTVDELFVFVLSKEKNVQTTDRRDVTFESFSRELNGETASNSLNYTCEPASVSETYALDSENAQLVSLLSCGLRNLLDRCLLCKGFIPAASSFLSSCDTISRSFSFAISEGMLSIRISMENVDRGQFVFRPFAPMECSYELHSDGMSSWNRKDELDATDFWGVVLPGVSLHRNDGTFAELRVTMKSSNLLARTISSFYAGESSRAERVTATPQSPAMPKRWLGTRFRDNSTITRIIGEYPRALLTLDDSKIESAFSTFEIDGDFDGNESDVMSVPDEPSEVEFCVPDPPVPRNGVEDLDDIDDFEDGLELEAELDGFYDTPSSMPLDSPSLLSLSSLTAASAGDGLHSDVSPDRFRPAAAVREDFHLSATSSFFRTLSRPRPVSTVEIEQRLRSYFPPPSPTSRSSTVALPSVAIESVESASSSSSLPPPQKRMRLHQDTPILRQETTVDIRVDGVDLFLFCRSSFGQNVSIFPFTTVRELRTENGTDINSGDDIALNDCVFDSLLAPVPFRSAEISQEVFCYHLFVLREIFSDCLGVPLSLPPTLSLSPFPMPLPLPFFVTGKEERICVPPSACIAWSAVGLLPFSGPKHCFYHALDLSGKGREETASFLLEIAAVYESAHFGTQRAGLSSDWFCDDRESGEILIPALARSLSSPIPMVQFGAPDVKAESHLISRLRERTPPVVLEAEVGTVERPFVILYVVVEDNELSPIRRLSLYRRLRSDNRISSLDRIVILSICATTVSSWRNPMEIFALARAGYSACRGRSDTSEVMGSSIFRPPVVLEHSRDSSSLNCLHCAVNDAAAVFVTPAGDFFTSLVRSERILPWSDEWILCVLRHCAMLVNGFFSGRPSRVVFSLMDGSIASRWGRCVANRDAVFRDAFVVSVEGGPMYESVSLLKDRESYAYFPPHSETDLPSAICVSHVGSLSDVAYSCKYTLCGAFGSFAESLDHLIRLFVTHFNDLSWLTLLISSSYCRSVLPLHCFCVERIKKFIELSKE